MDTALLSKCLNKRSFFYTHLERTTRRKEHMAALYEKTLCLILLILLPVPSSCVTNLSCTQPASTISLSTVIETFRYPSSGTYPTLTLCEWLFRSDTNTKMSFVLSNMNVDCGDILRFYDGSSSSDTSIDSAFCCTGCSYPAKFTTGNNLYAKFSTDSTLTASEFGFQVTILAGKDESNCASTGTVNNIQILSSTQTITLTSPNFPGAYPRSFECTYTYSYSSGTIRIQFLYVDVEPNGSNCYDFVEIYDGSSTSSPVLGKVCGTTLPDFINSTNTSMTLKFSSDGFSTNLGYKAIISPVHVGTDSTTAVKTTAYEDTTTVYPSTSKFHDTTQVYPSTSTFHETTQGSTHVNPIISTFHDTTQGSTNVYPSTSTFHDATQGSTNVYPSTSTFHDSTQGSTEVNPIMSTFHDTTQGSTNDYPSTSTFHDATQGSTNVYPSTSTFHDSTQGSTNVDSFTTVVSTTNKEGGEFGTTIKSKEKSLWNDLLTTVINQRHVSTLNIKKDKVIYGGTILRQNRTESVNWGIVGAGALIGIFSIAVLVLIALLSRKHCKKGKIDFENYALEPVEK
uniref:Cubilin-like isoform X5 n=1 Tax=Crassostrea virginica TaxID=6565 RepID=A0A8B8BPV9_CRAVI|nr:cubilin-like isoform X5 [Crassostrea virginica]